MRRRCSPTPRRIVQLDWRWGRTEIASWLVFWARRRATAESIDEAAYPECARCAEERRPEVQLRVIDTADLQIGQQTFCDEPQALGAPWQRAHHRGRRYQQHNPAVVHTLHVAAGGS